MKQDKIQEAYDKMLKINEETKGNLRVLTGSIFSKDSSLLKLSLSELSFWQDYPNNVDKEKWDKQEDKKILKIGDKHIQNMIKEITKRGWKLDQ